MTSNDCFVSGRDLQSKDFPRDAGFANAALQVDYDKNFLFYMTTKMPNPHYFPEVCIKAKL